MKKKTLAEINRENAQALQASIKQFYNPFNIEVSLSFKCKHCGQTTSNIEHFNWCSVISRNNLDV